MTGKVQIGDVYHRLTVLELVKDAKNPKAICQCECGNKTLTQRGALVNGRAKSCGCLRVELLSKHVESIKGTGKSIAEKLSDSNKKSRIWARNNPEKRKATVDRYYRKHTDKLQTYRQSNKARKQAYDRDYFAKNKERLAPTRRLNDHKRRLREVNARGTVSKDIVERLMLLQKCKCAICKRNLKITAYELDHIEPLAMGGKHDDSNFQLLCLFCNRSKGAKDPIGYMQSKGYLL